MSRLDLTDSTTQIVLLAAAGGALASAEAAPAAEGAPAAAASGWPLGRLMLEPAQGANPPLVVQQLLVKGLMLPSAELRTVQVTRAAPLSPLEPRH